MESIYAILGGLAIRVGLSAIVRYHSALPDHAFAYKDDLASTLSNINAASRSNLKLVTALIGIWEGVVSLHFCRKMPNSWDPYIAYGVRLFIDLIVTESIQRFVMVILWTGVGMVLSDVMPSIWREMGLHRIWGRTRRDLYRITRVMEKSVPELRFKVPSLPSLPRVRVVRFTGEEQGREQREREREQRRRERRERRRQAEAEDDEDEEEEMQEQVAETAPMPSILQAPSSTLESTVAAARRRPSPASELASILGSTASSATATPLLVAESISRPSRGREPERERVKERERVPIGLPTPSITTVTAPNRSYLRISQPSEGTASPALSSASTSDLEFNIDDYALDDDNRSSSAASFTAASSPQFTSASNLTPRIELLSPPSTGMLESIGLPADAPTPVYQHTGQRLQFLDTAIHNAPEVDAEDELMSNIAAEEEMLAIAGGMNRYEDEYEEGIATPKPRRNPYLPPTPSDSAAAAFGRASFARRDLPRDTSSILPNEEPEEQVVVPPTAMLQQIPDNDVEKEAPPAEEAKEERPPTPPAKDESFRATPPLSAASKLKSSSSKKAASALGVLASAVKPKESSSKSESKSVVSEGAATPQFSTQVLKPQAPVKEEAPEPVAPQAPITVATAGLAPPAPVGIALITPISADRSAGNIPVPPPAPASFASYQPFGLNVNVPQLPVPRTPASLLGGFTNPGVPGPDDDPVTSRGLPPAYIDWSADHARTDDGHDEEDDMYLDEETSKAHIELFRKKTEEREAKDQALTQQAQTILVNAVQQQTPDQTFIDNLVESPKLESPLPSPISPLSPLSPNTASNKPKDRKGRTPRGSVEVKKTDPVKSLVSHWNTISDSAKGTSYSEIGVTGAAGGKRRASGSVVVRGSQSQVGNGTRPPVLRRTSTSGILPTSSANTPKMGKSKKQEDDDEAERVAAAAIASAEALIALDQDKEEERRRKAEEEEAAVAAIEEAERQERARAFLEAEKARFVAQEAHRMREEEERLAAEARRIREEEERLAAEARRLREEEEERRRLAAIAEEGAQRVKEEEERRVAKEKARIEAGEARRLKDEQKRKEAEEKAKREAEEAAERLRLEEEARKKAEEKAEAKRLRKEENKRRKAEEKARKVAEEAEELRKKEAEEAVELERKRQEEEAAELMRKRQEEEAAELERKRQEEEAAEKERLRLEAEEAERERVRLEEEKERVRIRREKEEEEERIRKAKQKEQERQWKLEQEERKTQLAAAEEEKKKSDLAPPSRPDSRLSNADRDKDLPPPPPPDIEEAAKDVAKPPSAFGEGVDINWRPENDKKPAPPVNMNADLEDNLGNPWDAPAEKPPRTPTQGLVNLAGIGAGGRSEVGPSAVGRDKSTSPAPEIAVAPASESGEAAPDEEGEDEGDGEDEAGNDSQAHLYARPDDLASVSAMTEATEASQDIEKRLRKAISLRAQKAGLDQQLEELKAKSDGHSDEAKSTERVVRKFEKKIRRLYEDCQQQTFYYPSPGSASAILLQGISGEVARDHINEALLWHLTPETRSFSFTVTLPGNTKKVSPHDKAMRAVALRYLEQELKIKPVADLHNKKLFTVAVGEDAWDEWIAQLRRANTSSD